MEPYSAAALSTESEALDTYDAEEARGLVHAKWYRQRMEMYRRRREDAAAPVKDKCRAEDPKDAVPDCQRPLGHPGLHDDGDGCTWERSAKDRARV